MDELLGTAGVNVQRGDRCSRLGAGWDWPEDRAVSVHSAGRRVLADRDPGPDLHVHRATAGDQRAA